MPVPANYRWLLEDPVLATSYRVALNPNRMTSPYPSRRYETLTTIRSRILTRQTTPVAPFEWTFSGSIREQDHHDNLLAYSLVDNPIHITDHLGRVWNVMPQRFNSTELRPNSSVPDRYTYDFVSLMLGEV